MNGFEAGRVNRFSKLANWCKVVLGGRGKSTRGKPPQGKIKTKASRTRAKIASVIPEPEGSPISGQPGAAQRLEDQHLEATEIMDSEEGMITSEASKIFLRYLEGDQEAAKIVHGWAQKERDRTVAKSAGGFTCPVCAKIKPSENALRDHVGNVHPNDHCRLYHVQPCRAHLATEEYLAEQSRSASPSAGVHDDARHVDGGYARCPRCGRSDLTVEYAWTNVITSCDADVCSWSHTVPRDV